MPLDGYQVVELAQGLAGPFCAQYLAEGGADVIKIEPLHGDRTRGWGPPYVGQYSAVFTAINRGKRSIALDLETVSGQEVLGRLLRQADILVEDLQPGEIEMLGDGLSREHPDLIHCSLRDFSQEGPFSGQPGAELVHQALSSYLNTLSQPGEPPVRMGADAAELSAGMYAYLGILGAIYARAANGGGDHVEVEKAGALMAMAGIVWAAVSGPDEWFGLHCDSSVYPREHGVRTKDRPIYFILRRGDESNFDQLAIRLGIEWVCADPRFADGGRQAVGVGRYASEVKDIWEEAFQELTAEEALQIIREYGGDGAPFMDYPSLLEHPQIQSMDLFSDVEYPGHGAVKAVNVPFTISHSSSPRLGPAPHLGQHAEEILSCLGYSAAQVKELRTSAAVG